MCDDILLHMKIFVSKQKQRGFGLVEMLIGAAVLSTSLLGISTFFQKTLEVSSITQSAVQGDYLLEEGVEVVKLLRDAGYTNNIASLSTIAPTYLVWSGTNWATSTTNVFIDNKFERKITVVEVMRNASEDISGAGTPDPKTKLVTVSVAWNVKGATTTKTIQTYIMNIFNN